MNLVGKESVLLFTFLLGKCTNTFFFFTDFPVFRSSFQFRQIPINRSVVFSCLVAGYPIPTITWQHNEINVDSNTRVSTFMFGYESNKKDIFSISVDEIKIPGQLETLGILMISDVRHDDMGNYACIASNQLPQTLFITRKFSAGYLVTPGKVAVLLFCSRSKILSAILSA